MNGCATLADATAAAAVADAAAASAAAAAIDESDMGIIEQPRGEKTLGDGGSVQTLVQPSAVPSGAGSQPRVASRCTMARGSLLYAGHEALAAGEPCHASQVVRWAAVGASRNAERQLRSKAGRTAHKSLLSKVTSEKRHVKTATTVYRAEAASISCPLFVVVRIPGAPVGQSLPCLTVR